MLTVTEHLEFFGSVKGMMGRTLQAAIDGVINEVGLTEKRHVLSSALSGGMKRKLSLAIALIGNPRFLLLDEPTSGCACAHLFTAFHAYSLLMSLIFTLASITFVNNRHHG